MNSATSNTPSQSNHSDSHQTLRASLSGHDARTYDKIFQHPVAHDLRAGDAASLLRKMGYDISESHHGLTATRSGQQLSLHLSSVKEIVDVAEVLKIRHFLSGSSPVPATGSTGTSDYLIVIDHHEARIFNVMERDQPHQRIAAMAYSHQGSPTHEARNFSSGKERSDPRNYFEAIATAMHSARRVLLFGNGTGTGNEMEQFSAWVAIHHPLISAKIIGRHIVDTHHLTEGEQLAQAVKFYANL